MGNNNRGSVPGARRFSRARPTQPFFGYVYRCVSGTRVMCNTQIGLSQLLTFCTFACGLGLVFSQLSSFDLWFSSFPGVYLCFLRVSELEILRG